jgi:hypothetical protein
VAFLEERGSAEPEASVELALVAAAAAVAADAPVAAEVVFVALLAAAEVVFVPLPFPSSLYTSMKSPTQRNAINLTWNFLIPHTEPTEGDFKRFRKVQTVLMPQLAAMIDSSLVWREEWRCGEAFPPTDLDRRLEQYSQCYEEFVSRKPKKQRKSGFRLDGGRVGDKLEGVKKNRARALPERPHPLEVLHRVTQESNSEVVLELNP